MPSGAQSNYGIKQHKTLEDIALKCLTCKQGKWVDAVHVCLRKTCKYLTSHKSAYWIGREGV